MTLIFDWDGTLHDTLRLYGQAFRCAYSELVKSGYAPSRYYSDEEVSIYLGMNTPDMWNSFMPELPQEVKIKAGDTVGREMVRLIEDGKASLYDGVPAMLDRLLEHGHKLIFLSNCKHSYQEAHRRYFGLDRWFSGYYCCEDYDNIPKNEIFPSISAVFPGPYLMIGDRASDFDVARLNGFKSIGCEYGFGTPEELRLADYTVRSCADIPRCVELAASNV